jgi:tetratricopeptide (TPR) repeat protein
MTLQNYQGAVAAYDKAIALAPKKAAALINRGISLTKMQRYQEALKSYERAIVIKPDKPEVYYNQACTYALQSNVELATANLQKAIQLDAGKYQQLAKIDPDFDKVRTHKQFQELIH